MRWIGHVLGCAESLSRVRLFATPWMVARQAPLSVGIPQARILAWVASLQADSLPAAWESFIWVPIPLPSWTSRPSSPVQSAEPGPPNPAEWGCWKQLPTSSLFYAGWCIHVDATLPVLRTLPFPSWAHKSFLSICISIPALQRGSPVPFL